MAYVRDIKYEKSLKAKSNIDGLISPSLSMMIWDGDGYSKLINFHQSMSREP